MNLVPKLPDRYEILGTLGAGGMGTVYKVHDSTLDKIVALKVLRIGTGSSDELLVRFNQEARACARLKHKNIIEILDFGFFHGITPYMVLEYIEGQTLKQHIAEKGPLSAEVAINVFAQIASALSHAHSQKIIHRDLKPSNIIITDNTDPFVIKLFDFGIARIAEDVESMKLTAANSFVGTPTYMSPEQIRNESSDARSDIYSFGCVMFETLTGEVPFSSPEILTLIDMQLNAEPPRIGDVVSEYSESTFETVIDRCLQKRPEDRFPSCEEISKHLNMRPANDSSSSPSPPSEPGRTSWIKIGTALGVLLIAVTATVIMIDRREKEKKNLPVKVTRKKISAKAKAKRREHILKVGMDPNGTELHLLPIDDYEDADIKLIPNDGTIQQLDITTPGYTSNSRNEANFAPHNLSERGFEYVSKLTKLKGIKLHGADDISVRSIGYLAQLPNLTSLDANNTSFTDVRSLAQLKKLETGIFDSFGPDDVAVLKHMPLQSLTLDRSTLNEPMLKSISSLKHLHTLHFYTCMDVNAASLLHLKQLPHLDKLSIDGTPSIGNGGIASIATLKQIRRLSLKSDRLNDDHLKPIANMTGLKELLISDNKDVTKIGLQHLSKLPSLMQLDVSDCRGIKPKDVQDFLQSKNAIKNSTHVVENFAIQNSEPM